MRAKMLWFKRKPQTPPVPYKWTQGLWTEAFLADAQRFHGLALITALHKRYELQRERDGHPGFQTRIEYFGHLTHEPGSPINFVGVRLSFDIRSVSHEWASVPDSAVGFVTTHEWTDTYKNPCYLGVTVRTTEAGALQFEKVFHRAKANGQDFIPLWLWGDQPAPPMEGDAFACTQPLSSVAFQQKVSLVGRPNQDE